MKKIFILCSAVSLLFMSCASQQCGNIPDVSDSQTDASQAEYTGPVYQSGKKKAQQSTFREIWAYLIDGREENLSYDMPITDIGYFGATVSTYGELSAVPDVSKLDMFPGRVHLVVTCDSRSLTHFALLEGSETRKQLITDLIEASEAYDGLQIDFELVPARDGNAFFTFLQELSTAMKKKNKLFTIALPARTRVLNEDVYDYARITPLVDRLFVMAYDEHWSNSVPGSIASLDWCERVAKHALEQVGTEKLIMGLPFYGRTWGSENTFRAFQFAGINRIMREQNITFVARENEIPTFTYDIPLTVNVYFEDVHSLAVRLNMYRDMGIYRTGFWCLGQEDPRIWEMISVAP